MGFKQVKLPSGYFFKRVVKDYQSWRAALVREYIQNSFDAGATKIDFIFRDGVLLCEDNGSGMSWQTVEEYLLTLGGTGKDGDKPVGGFGVAKEILYFSWPKWSIETGDIRVVGREGTYKRTDNVDRVKGVRSKIQVGDILGKEESVRLLIEAYLMLSDLGNVEVTYNGNLLTTPPLVRGEKIYSIEGLGNLYQENSNIRGVFKETGGITVLAHSILYMFSIRNYSKTCYVFDITHDSYNCLTANRDGFTDEWSDEFAKMFGKILIDSESTRISRQKAIIVRNSKNGEGLISLDSLRQSPTGQSIGDFCGKSPEQITSSDMAEFFQNSIPVVEVVSDSVTGGIVSPIEISVIKPTKPVVEAMEWIYDRFEEGFMILSETLLNTVVFKRLYLRDTLKILTLWREIIKDSASCLGKEIENTVSNYGYGAIISDHTEALVHKGYFLINPFMFDHIKSWEDTIIKFTMLACHEIAHCSGVHLHNERFNLMFDEYLYTVLCRTTRLRTNNNYYKLLSQVRKHKR